MIPKVFHELILPEKLFCAAVSLKMVRNLPTQLGSFKQPTVFITPKLNKDDIFYVNVLSSQIGSKESQKTTDKSLEKVKQLFY